MVIIRAVPKAILFLISLLIVTFSHSFAADTAKIKILAINPSPTSAIEADIYQPLPPEVQPEDIVEAQGLTAQFDQETNSYVLMGKVNLSPMEKKTLIVEVRDVWGISEERIQEILQKLNMNIETLKGTAYELSSKMLAEKVLAQIDTIQTEQAQPMGFSKKVDLYRAHLKQIEAIEQQVISLHAMRTLNEQNEGGIRTIKFKITAQNPSSEERTMVVRSVLPEEVTAESVIDKLDFLLLFDDRKNRFILEKNDTFGPKELKTYTVTIKDLWYIPDTDLDFVVEQTEKLKEHFDGTQYEVYAAKQIESIKEAVTEIKSLQNEVKDDPSIENRIRAYTLNNQRFNLAKKKLKELQDLVLEVPGKRALNVIEQMRQQLAKIKQLLDILKLGFQPDLSTTWWLILGIIGFLAVLSTTFYVTWLKKLGEMKWGKKDKKGKKSAKQETEPKPVDKVA